jgi:hypothetical protein
MTSPLHTVHIDVTIDDEEALYQAALNHAVNVDGLSRQEAIAMLKDDDQIEVTACLITLFDPGKSPGGTSIRESYVS